MERLETIAAPRYVSKLAARALNRLRCHICRITGRLLTYSGRKKALPGKKRRGYEIPPSPNTGVWYNAAQREAGYRRGF